MASSGNFCTWNPINAQGGGKPDLTRSGTLTNGNLNYNPGSYGIIIGSVGVQTGKWYWELRATGANASGPVVGWLNENHTSGGSGAPSPGYSSPSSAANAQFLMIYMIPGSGPAEITAGTPSGSSSGTDTDKSGITTNDIIGVAGDFDNDKWYFSINGSFTDFRSGQDPASGTNPICSGPSGGGLTTFTRVSGLTWYPTYGNWSASGKASYTNFGQDSTFGGEITAGGNADESGFGDFKYSVPAGFKAMCSGNLPISADIDPTQTDSNFPAKQFNAITYTGNSSTNAISGLGFQPDMFWFHRRDYTGSYNQGIIDSNRGVTLGLYPDRTNIDTNFSSDFNSFDSDGFTLKAGSSANINNSSSTFVGWCWRANAGTTASNTQGSITSTVQANTKAGFSIITFTSPNSSSDQTVGHGLTQAPEFIIAKNRDATYNWDCYHHSLSDPTYGIRLNTNDAPLSGRWGSVGATTIGTKNAYTHNGTDDYVFYAWHSVEGYSKFGGYTGNQDTDGNFIYTGFRPRLLAIRNLGTAGDGWRVYDSARETGNVMNLSLSWHNSNAESTGTSNNLDFLSNGFKLKAANPTINWGSSYGPYIYMCWGDIPFKTHNTF